MTPGSIISVHNVLSTVPVSERYLSACYMPTPGIFSRDVVFRVLVQGQVVYNGPGSPATPTCVRLQYPMDMPNGAEVRVQAIVNGSMVAEDLYKHEEVSPVSRTLKNVEQATSQIDPQKTFFILAICAFLFWYLFIRKDDEDEIARRRRMAAQQTQFQLPEVPKGRVQR